MNAMLAVVISCALLAGLLYIAPSMLWLPLRVSVALPVGAVATAMTTVGLVLLVAAWSLRSRYHRARWTMTTWWLSWPLVVLTLGAVVALASC